MHLRRPYVEFEDFLRDRIHLGSRVLDLCSGTGKYAMFAAVKGAQVTCADMALNSLKIAEMRAVRAGVKIAIVQADAEELPFGKETFQIVTCVGSLSYLSLPKFLKETHRVLEPGGYFVCVDSLNHNPVYRLNRSIQWILRRRALSTLQRMPTLKTIAELQRHFCDSRISYHGSLAFVAPVLRPFFGERLASQWLDGLNDRTPVLRRWAFKFAFCGQKPPI